MPEQRKTVTILFCDLAGSTALGESVDPERLRALLASYFERMKEIVEHHGGSVEKFIGDAVMAVFGVPVLHEDDALRAVRAAIEMRNAFPELELEGRIGVMTGEVVTGTEERLATGDAVNVAARLEQAAQPGDVLIGQPTLDLVRDAVDAEPLEPLALKGKAKPVAAFRLLRVRDAPERRHDRPFVGRDAELLVLRESWERTTAQRRCELVTIVGDPGVGKSRLAAELVGSLDAMVCRGRCLPYGDGITYWPVVEVLKQLGLMPTDESAASAIRSLLGESDVATTTDEIAWAFRKTLEQHARDQPLLVLFEDIQWGEEAFLDLVEHVGLLSTGAPILALCLARPELLERRPTWPVTVRLGSLDDDDVRLLMPQRLDAEVRTAIAHAAGGNPLFVEEMVAISDERSGHVVVPPTLQALLAARLDRLPLAERLVLEHAAVEGEVFHRGAVLALAPADAQVTRQLAALVRRDMIRPETPLVAREDGFRFRHILIRDAAYDALPKATRAKLHAAFAAWLEENGTDLVELDELVGYHLERAQAYRAEVGLPVEESHAVAARGRLAAAGRRASARGDVAAAANLFDRALSLGLPDEIDVPLELELATALAEIGRGQEALERLESFAERAAARNDQAGELAARLKAAITRTFTAPEGAAAALETLANDALPVLEAAGDDVALYTAYHGLAWAAFIQGKCDRACDAYERAAVHAHRARLPDDLLGWSAMSRLWGSTPATELLEWLDEQEPGAAAPNHTFGAPRAMAMAMLGRFDEARAALAAIRTELADRGGGLLLGALTGIESTEVELWAGDARAAASLGAEGCRLLDELGDEGFLSNAASCFARALYAVEQLDEAEAWAERAREISPSEDLFAQMGWRPVLAKIRARRGAHREGEHLAGQAVAIAARTDSLNGQADSHADLAEVLLLAGRHEEAAAALVEARDRYERKGNLVLAQRIRERLRELQPVG